MFKNLKQQGDCMDLICLIHVSIQLWERFKSMLACYLSKISKIMSNRMFSGRRSRQARCLRRIIRFDRFHSAQILPIFTLVLSIFTDQVLPFSTGPSLAHFHSAHLLPLFTKPKFCPFSIGPSFAHFHSA